MTLPSQLTYTGVVLAVLAVAGMLNARDVQASRPSRLEWNAQIAAGLLVAVLATFIHARGSLSVETRLWNARPVDIDASAERLWDWHNPQFLAGLVRPSYPASGYPLVPTNQPIDITSAKADSLLWYGWSEAEPGVRWTVEKEAAIVFSLEKITDTTMTMRVAPFIVSGKLEQQPVTVKLNGQELETVALKESKAAELSILLPAAVLRKENLITLELPNATAPEVLGLSDERRLLGIAVQWAEFRQ